MFGIDLAERRTGFFGQTVGQVLALRATEVLEGHDRDSDSLCRPVGAQLVQPHDSHDDESRETDGPQAQPR